MFLLKARQKTDAGALKVILRPSTGVPSTAYKYNGLASNGDGQIYIELTDTVAATAIKTEGYAVTPDGALYVTTNPSQTFVTRYGYRTTLDGRLLVTFTYPGSGLKANGNVFDSNGAVHVEEDGQSFEAQFADAGSGAVNLTLARGTGSATFTRATTATTVNSSGQIISVASGVARSYYDPTTLAYRGYLEEGARTNEAFQSQDFGTTWVQLNTTVDTTGVSDPAGGTTADKITATNSAGAHLNYQPTASRMVSGTTYALSFFVKPGTHNYVSVNLLYTNAAQQFVCKVFDLSNGTVGETKVGTTSGTLSSASITQYPGGWYRITMVGSATGTTANGFIEIGLASAATGNTFNTSGEVTFAAAGTETIFVWGAQLEAGSFASTYIPTTTAAVTRNIDVDSYPTSGNIIAALGTWYGRVTFTHTPSGTVFLWGTYVDASNYTAVLHDGTNLIFRKRIAGVNTDATQALAFTAGTQYKIACSWGALGQLIAINGASGTSDANTTAAQIAATMQYGADGNGANAPFAAQMDDRIYQTQFTAANLQALTA